MDLSKDWNYILGLRPREVQEQSTWQLGQFLAVKAMKRRWILFVNGLSHFLGVLGNGRLVREVESAIYCPFSGAHARLSLSWD